MIEEAKGELPWPAKIFLVGLVIPWIIPLGPLNLSVYRIILLISLLPCFLMWIRGKAGPIRVADVAVILLCFWASLSLAVVHGFQSVIEAIGIFNLETLGAYMLGRCYIRTADDFRNMVQLASKLIAILLPFALYEWITGGKALLSTFAMVFPTVEVTLMQPRWGFWRAQGPFSHPILFGLFCASVVALAYMGPGYGKSALSRWAQPAAISLATCLSMSSAPIAGVMLQLVLLGWDSLLRSFEHRWKLLWGIVFMGYLVVEFGSNQTPLKFYISHFTFDAQTGWFRFLIWELGSASVAKHPLFGIGDGEWERPSWMPGSVDNFWLVVAMRHGIPAVVLIFGAFMLIVCGVAFKKGLADNVDAYRTGYVICMVMFLLVGCTVHFWAAPYAWFLFLLGSGAWILDVKPLGNLSPETPGTGSSKVRRVQTVNRAGFAGGRLV
ncbi:O-antigen ligase family protein [Sinorhizobium meliloti]|uniref:O-antigen ligase family protein n=1 Tax=Rhizobium meliloti TaxID=382 RepID=UPI00036AEDE6|nr:O-antigen ligase family protein [Sinorhizobium meliloti]